ncbi:MAG: hypothetical protein IKA08_02270 [Alphaproteobacteria bacterium]|nr:hypothetical protein [Alphaproteobacteria bacterium]
MKRFFCAFIGFMLMGGVVWAAVPYCTSFKCSNDTSFCNTPGLWCANYGAKFGTTYNGVRYQNCMPVNGHVVTPTSDTMIVCFQDGEGCESNLWGATNSNNNGQSSAKYECPGMQTLATRTAYYWRCGPGASTKAGYDLYTETTSSAPIAFAGCTKCPVGTANPNPASKSCSKCTGFYYSDEAGLTACKKCPDAPNNATAIPWTGTSGASTTIDNCKWECDAGYYGSSDNGNTSCADCGQGYFCPGGIERVECPAGTDGSAMNNETSNCGGGCKTNPGQYSAKGSTSGCKDCPASNISGYTPLVLGGAGAITDCYLSNTGSTPIYDTDTFGRFKCTSEKLYYSNN